MSDFVQLELALIKFEDNGDLIPFDFDDVQSMLINPKYIIHVQHNNERTPNELSDENNSRHQTSEECESCNYDCDCHTEVVCLQGNTAVSFRTEAGADKFMEVQRLIRAALQN